jgi:hypothetical protein
MQSLYATLLSYPKQYATVLGNRLWKRYASALGKWYVTVCGNGM